jgi:hypothetical protein
LVHSRPAAHKVLDPGTLGFSAAQSILLRRDPGTLGASQPDPGPFLNAQICRSNDVGRSPTSSGMFPGLISWLDEWLANVRFESSGGEVIELRFEAD